MSLPFPWRTAFGATLGVSLTIFSGCGDSLPSAPPASDAAFDTPSAADTPPPPNDAVNPAEDRPGPPADRPASEDSASAFDAPAAQDVAPTPQDRPTPAMDAVRPPVDAAPGFDASAPDRVPVDAGPIACASTADCPPELFCTTAICGARGVCAPRPRVCDRITDPVCGCNRRTYTNACEANADGQSVASRGECASLLDAGAGTPDRLPPVCAAVLCAAGMLCCDAPGAAFYGMCYDPRCLSCCVPGMRVDAGPPDVGASRCALVRCSAGTTCCMRPGSINDGMCFPNACADCCR